MLPCKVPPQEVLTHLFLHRNGWWHYGRNQESLQLCMEQKFQHKANGHWGRIFVSHVSLSVSLFWVYDHFIWCYSLCRGSFMWQCCHFNLISCVKYNCPVPRSTCCFAWVSLNQLSCVCYIMLLDAKSWLLALIGKLFDTGNGEWGGGFRHLFTFVVMTAAFNPFLVPVSIFGTFHSF